MRSAFFLFREGFPRPGKGGADFARFALLTSVRKSADHQLVSLADLPTKVT